MSEFCRLAHLNGTSGANSKVALESDMRFKYFYSAYSQKICFNI